MCISVEALSEHSSYSDKRICLKRLNGINATFRKPSPPPPSCMKVFYQFSLLDIPRSQREAPRQKPVRWVLNILTSSARMHPKSEPEDAHPGPGHRPEARSHRPHLPQQKKLTLGRRGAHGGRDRRATGSQQSSPRTSGANGHTCVSTHQQSCVSGVRVGWRL